jgi:hypothetical protein
MQVESRPIAIKHYCHLGTVSGTLTAIVCRWAASGGDAMVLRPMSKNMYQLDFGYTDPLPQCNTKPM